MRKHDDLVIYHTRESIVIQLEAFGDEFERLARTAKQQEMARRFNDAVGDIAKESLSAAELEQLGDWLKGYCKHFEELASSEEQKELVASFKEFIGGVTSPAVKEAFQRALVNELVAEIETVMVDEIDGVPFGWLSPEEKKEVLSVAIEWIDYLDRGLEIDGGGTDEGIGRIIDNAIARKPSDQWMGRPKAAADFLEEVLGRQAKRTANSKDKERGIER